MKVHDCVLGPVRILLAGPLNRPSERKSQKKLDSVPRFWGHSKDKWVYKGRL